MSNKATYFDDFYPRFYSLFCSAESWMVYLIVIFVISFIVAILQDSRNPHKKQIMYFAILFSVGIFILRILAWLFLPSPEYFGLTR